MVCMQVSTYALQAVKHSTSSDFQIPGEHRNIQVVLRPAKLNNTTIKFITLPHKLPIHRVVSGEDVDQHKHTIHNPSYRQIVA